MLTVSPLRSTKDGNQGEMENFSFGNCDFADLSDGNLLESINFDDLFVGFNVDGDVLPDLEMDSDMFADFSVSGGEESEMNSSASVENKDEDKGLKKKVDEDKTTSSSHGSGLSLGEEIVSKRDESVVLNPSPKDSGKGRKSSSQTKNQQGKRKVKVDWTPELHRRFVQAVEQLGVDKAVPSRILEIMGIDCLTRHNIASHLQKYRSHRKHLLAREAEAASWNQRRHLYGVAVTCSGGGKREVSSWPTVAPTMGFPPMTPMQHFRPLHVWGHPSMPVWPNPVPHSPQLPWAPVAAPPTPQDPSLWHAQHQRPSSAVIPARAPCFPAAPLTTARFGCSPVPSIPPHTMYKAADHGIVAPGSFPGPFFDFHPSKESIDAAIGDVLSKPWLPLPLGLKAPALDSVMGELHKQGISDIPPPCA